MEPFGIVTGVFGLINGPRSAIKTAYTDIHTWKKYKRFWREADRVLTVQLKALEKWEDKWMFYNNIPIPMYHDFWGEEGYKKIKSALDQAEKDATELSKYLKITGSIKEPGGKSVFAELGYILRRFQFVLATHEKCDYLVNALAEGIKSVEDVANACWEQQSTKYSPRLGAPIRDTIYHHAIKTGLAIFAVEIRYRADKLFDLYSEADMLLYMALDLLSIHTEIRHGGREAGETKHVQAIATAYEKSLPEFVILARKPTNNACIILSARELPQDQKNIVSGTNGEVLHISKAFKRATKGRVTRFEIQAEYGNDNKRLVELSLDNSHMHIGDSNRTVLDLFSAGSRRFGDRGWKLLKLKLAYELSLAYFMLYCCKSLSKVCICRLRSAVRNAGHRDGDLKNPELFEFTIDTDINHNSEAAPCQCACHADPVTSFESRPVTAPIRRLGLLLIQIAFNGSRFTNIEVKNNGDIHRLSINGRDYDLDTDPCARGHFSDSC
jgi:hypothetical protein